MRRQQRSRPLSRKLVFLGAGALLALVFMWLLLSPGGTGDPAHAAPRPVRIVTVVETSATEHRAEIVGLAEVYPRWTSTLRTQVGGMLRQVSDRLQPGNRILSGEPLATIDRTAWRANLADAENQLALAELELLREKQEAAEARQSWRESGLTGEPSSRLVLREPQVDATGVQLEAARAARDWAARQLEYTVIRAPFPGIVAARHISRGESILEGEAVAEIFSTEVFELALQVSESQWRALAVPVVGTEADLVDPEGPGRWRAQVARVGGSIDPTTRMRTLYLEVSDPLASEPPLLPGSFVRVHIAGGEPQPLLELPEGALTRSGHVWFVDAEDTLRRFATEAVFTRPGQIYISEPLPATTWRIVRYPLDSFIVGQAVSTQSLRQRGG